MMPVLCEIVRGVHKGWEEAPTSSARARAEDVHRVPDAQQPSRRAAAHAAVPDATACPSDGADELMAQLTAEADAAMAADFADTWAAAAAESELITHSAAVSPSGSSPERCGVDELHTQYAPVAVSTGDHSAEPLPGQDDDAATSQIDAVHELWLPLCPALRSILGSITAVRSCLPHVRARHGRGTYNA